MIHNPCDMFVKNNERAQLNLKISKFNLKKILFSYVRLIKKKIAKCVIGI